MDWWEILHNSMNILNILFFVLFIFALGHLNDYKRRASIILRSLHLSGHVHEHSNAGRSRRGSSSASEKNSSNFKISLSPLNFFRLD